MDRTQIYGQVGPTQATSMPDGCQSFARLGNMGEFITSDLHGVGYESTYRDGMFSVCNSSAVALSAGTSTTFTGLVVGNPAASVVNLVLRHIRVGKTAASSAATVLGIMTGAGAITASLTPVNRKFGSSVASAVTASAGLTLPATPVFIQPLCSFGTVATTGYASTGMVETDSDGDIIIMPGRFLATYSSAANTAAYLISFTWEEVPI